MSVLRSAELVDHRGQWVGKDTTLVQTGDIVDRGRDTIALYRLMDTLRVEAELAGGQVISLLGNHEVGTQHPSQECDSEIQMGLTVVSL